MGGAAKTPDSHRISDAAVRGRTGKTWNQWFDALDAAGAAQMSHKEIVALLRDRHDIGFWWCQTVTVAYEQARGMRRLHEMPDGFQIGKSKTVGVPLGKLYRAWADGGRRAEWLPDETVRVRTAKRDKSMRLDWSDGKTLLAVHFRAKGARRSQVTVNHEKLPTAERAEQMKTFWAERLAALKAYLEG